MSHKASYVNLRVAGRRSAGRREGFKTEIFRRAEDLKAISGVGEAHGSRTRFAGMAGLKKILLDHSDEFVAAVSEKLLMYAAGRNQQYYDAPVVREIAREAARSQYTFSSLVLGVVKSAPFRMRQAQ